MTKGSLETFAIEFGFSGEPCDKLLDGKMGIAGYFLIRVFRSLPLTHFPAGSEPISHGQSILLSDYRKGTPAMKSLWSMLCLGLFIVAAGCGGNKAEIKEDRLTVGKVQGEIKVGMSAAQVAELLGSPNIVTTDDKRREVWIYDKVSTDRVDTSNSSFGGIIILGATARDSSSSQRQRTLTIIIKYDEEKKVRDFAYNATQF